MAAQGISEEQAVAYLQQLEQAFVVNASNLRGEINRRLRTPRAEGGWRTGEEARAMIDNLDDAGKAAQFEGVLRQLIDDLATLPTIYHSMMQPDIQAPPAAPAVRDLLLALHNPMVRESLLIPVSPDYRDAMREFMAEIAGICWGFVEVTAGQAGPHHRTYLTHLADAWNIDDVDRLASVLNLG